MNPKERVAIIQQFVVPIIALMTTTLVGLGVEISTEHKFYIVLVATILSSFIMVSLLFIDEMQERRKVMQEQTKEMQANRIFKTDMSLAQDMAENGKRLCVFINKLKSDVKEDRSPIHTKDHIVKLIEELGKKLNDEPDFKCNDQ